MPFRTISFYLMKLKILWFLLLFILPSHFAFAVFILDCQSPQIPYQMFFTFPLWGKISEVQLHSKKEESDFKVLTAKCDKKKAQGRQGPFVAVCQVKEGPQKGIKINLMTTANTKVDAEYKVSYTPYGPTGDGATVEALCFP